MLGDPETVARSRPSRQLLEDALDAGHDEQHDGARVAYDAELAWLRGEGRLGRSERQRKLFDFLATRDPDAPAPKEWEIAQAVFARQGDFDPAEDAIVRVAVHKLRHRLEALYAVQGLARPSRLRLPVGQYRLLLEPASVASAETFAPTRTAQSGATRPGPVWIAAAVGLAVVSSLVTGVAVHVSRPPVVREIDTMMHAPVWAPLARNGRPTVIVLGDYYIMGRSPDGVEVNGLARQFDINSREDLDQYLMAHPDNPEGYVNLDLGYLPVSVGAALRDILPLTGGAARERPRVILASELTPEILKTSNIVYVGYLSGLGRLKDVALAGSRFAIGQTFDEIIDTKSGQRWISQGGPAAAGRGVYRDYGYFATMAGPGGGRIIIVAGARDEGLMQAADLVSRPSSLEELVRKVAGAENFEGLYAVEGLDRDNLSGQVLVAAARPR